MKNVVLVLDLAATFGGNIIQSMKALQASDEILARYVLPEVARGRDWIPELTEVHYTDWSLSSLHKVWRELNQAQPVDIVHFHFVGGKNALRCKLAFSPREKMIWHLHNHVGHKAGKLAWLKDLAKRYLYHDAYEIGVSKSVSDSVCDYSSDRNITTVYNAMDFSRLEEIGEEHVIDTESKAIRCMIMGNHYDRKGVDIAAKAVQMLNRGGHPAVLYVALNDSRVPAMNEFLRTFLGTDDFSSYIKPIPVRNDIATYYNKMDVFLSPSREEGWTWAIDEAAYCGCQVVVSKIPGQDENTVPGFFWCGNPNTEDITQEMADQILSLSQMPEEEKKRTTAAARDYMIKEFSMDKWVENILAVYNRNSSLQL
jgi:glycosyltransferase involved in cell wall biosynthesis